MIVAVSGEPDEVQAFVAWVLKSDSPLEISDLKTEGDRKVAMFVEIDAEAAWHMRQAGKGFIDAATLHTRLAQIAEAKRRTVNPEHVRPEDLR